MGSTSEDIIKDGLPLVMLMAVGYLCARFWRSKFAPWVLEAFNRFVFNISIPATVFKGLATKDLRDLDWDFVGLFVLLRVASAVAVLAAILLAARFRGGASSSVSLNDLIGEFLVGWIATTWINTVIFGIPLIVSLYGPRAIILNILAALGSLIFQLPVMLILFEIRAARTLSRPEKAIEQGQVVTTDLDSVSEGTASAAGSSSPSPNHNHKPTSSLWSSVVSVLVRVVRNPPMAGILLGLLYSLIIRMAIGDTRFPWWVDKPVQYVADCLTPLAAFSLGMFAFRRERDFFHTWQLGTIILVAKFVLLPLLCLGLAYALDIGGIKGRAAVLIASLPIAVASFPLTHKYFGVGGAATSKAAGTVSLATVTSNGQAAPEFNGSSVDAPAAGEASLGAEPTDALASSRLWHTFATKQALESKALNQYATVLVAGQVIAGSVLMAPVFLAWNAILEETEAFGNFTKAVFVPS